VGFVAEESTTTGKIEVLIDYLRCILPESVDINSFYLTSVNWTAHEPLLLWNFFSVICMLMGSKMNFYYEIGFHLAVISSQGA
jgi:hypothetical protein